MNTELTTLFLRLEANLQKSIESSKADVLREIDEVKKRQDISNGRVGKLESARASAVRRLDRLEVRFKDTGSILASMSPGQKAKLAGFAVLIAGAAAEAIHKALPLLVSVLAAKVPQP